MGTDNISFGDKFSFLVDKYKSICSNCRSINYLGITFYYDNRFVPSVLELFPMEISTIDKQVDFKSIKTVLDVGANIGQFSFTLKRFFPNIKVYCFEPNPEPFEILKKNLKKEKLFNYGLGIVGKRDFNYNKNNSAEGNLYGNGEIKIEVNIVDINKLNIIKEFDLVKIDVEGAELEVIDSLKDIKFKYLYIECVDGKNMVEITNKLKDRNPELLSFTNNLNALFKMRK